MPLLQVDAPWPHRVFEAAHSHDQLRLVPERGGLLCGWRCAGREILYLDAARFVDPALSVRGGMPVLFPICGNLPGDLLPLAAGSYPLRQHGFARELPWHLEPLASGDGVALELAASAATWPHYPFAFRLRLELRLLPAALAITARISHDGDPAAEPMPFSFGLHPYLAVADPAAVRIEGLPSDCFDHLTMAPAPTAAQLARLGQGVDFLCEPVSTARLFDPVSGLAVRLVTTPPWDCVVVWSEPPRPMVCLEPWTGPRGALVSGDRRLLLPPGASLRLDCRYEVEVAGGTA